MEDKIREIVANVAGSENPSELNPEADIFKDIGIQSTAALDLLLSLEEEFEVTIEDEAFAEARSIRALAKLVAELS